MFPSQAGFSSEDTGQPIPLDMATDAVDDMYDGCDKDMEELVKNKFFIKENIGIFGEAWNKAKLCSDEKYPKKQHEVLRK